MVSLLMTLLPQPTLGKTGHGPHPYNGECKWPDEKPGKLTLGIRVGAGYSRIGSLTDVLASGDKRPTHTWGSKAYVMPALSLFCQYRIHRVGFEAEGGYYSQGASLLYRNTVPHREEASYRFVNHYVGAGLNVKLHLARGFYMGVGGRYGFHVGEQRVDFDYSGTSAKRMDVRQDLEEQLAVGDEISAGVSLGWEHVSGFHIEARYMQGLTDILTVNRRSVTGRDINTDGYADRNCPTSWAALTFGFSVAVFDGISKVAKTKPHRMTPHWRYPAKKY